MKLSRLACCCALLLAAPLQANNDPFAELSASVAEVNKSQAEIDKEYAQFVAQRLAEYSQWRKAYLAEYDAYRAEVIAEWGEGLLSEPLVTVDYSDDKSTRTVVDLENNEATISVLVDQNTTPEQAAKQVKQAAAAAVAKTGSTLAEVVAEPGQLPNGKIAEAQVDYSEAAEKSAKKAVIEQARAQLQEIDKESEAVVAKMPGMRPEIAESVAVKQKEQLVEETKARLASLETTYDEAREKAASLTTKKVVEYRIQLPANGIGKRAAKFVGFAESESERFDIPAALVMAIMHSESSFNPKAKSPIPAYGLMQIVPTTAGHDVNARIRQKNEPMKPAELYVADVNVETGTAYLNILDKSYLKSITNEQSRLYCTIAAYNTGAGNVAKAFNPDGSRNIRKAAKYINSLTPQQVYDKLMADLPYDETKNYLKKVTSRISLYEQHSA